MKDSAVKMRFDEPAIDEVRGATEKEKSIAHVRKPPHLKGG
jgi:hypothetical protein